ncbi:hypothetical protein K435DRAFT_775608 [Dendrothele bispora CBS 962.96]|uniref:Uncharacterized protein n=1 Tax=Dendrothele bispora (strain CBS 962.96) TaxID=1314807 RepID=A0A4S8MI76_DENBC|nr:hypothetical protein K435DRAFT_775608 [Dendrothele bispora CBS 962.96]
MDDSSFAPSALPRLIWTYYVDYLVNYKPNSLVAKIASSFRVLAVLLIMPILILALLDISSYVIARTLGVVDDVRASTSDRQTVHTIADSSSSSSSPPLPPPIVHVQEPSIHVESSSPSPGNSGECSSSQDNHHKLFTLDSSQSSLTATTPDGFSPLEYFTSEDNNLKLSGVGVFSPAPSQPPSPTISRRTLAMDGRFAMTELDAGDEGAHIRRRQRQSSESSAQ